MSKTIQAVIIAFSSLFFLWEVVGRTSEKFSFFASKPSDFFLVWASELSTASYWSNFGSTLIALTIGYFLSILTGYILGVVSYYLKKRDVDLEIVLLIFGSIPVFALAPLFILSLGTGLSVRVSIVVVSSVFLVATGVFNAIKFADQEFGSIARDLSYSPALLWKKFLLPAGIIYSVPSFKGAVALSLIGIFVAEWISSQNGIGKYILSAMSLYDSDRLIVGIGSFMIISSAFMILITGLEKKTSAWRNFR